MHKRDRWLCWFALAIPLAVSMLGCSVLTDNSLSASMDLAESQENAAVDESKIANPPARTIRFDGHEIVLGDAESKQIDTDQFVALLEPLVAKERFRSAIALVHHHRQASERLLAERWATDPDDPVVRLVANTLSERSGRSNADWNSLLKIAKERPKFAKPYQDARNAFATELQTGDPSAEQAAQLQLLAQHVAHPLASVDCLRLLGLRELVAERTAWAESLCRQAVDVATRSGNALLAAELWLMVAEAARRSEQVSPAAQAWSKGVTLHLNSMKKELPIDVNFWLLAEHTRPADKAWPSELTQLLTPYVRAIDCEPDASAEMALWTSIAQAQFERGELQAALINFKRAETLVTGDNVLWLRIAQSKCLAAMGQVPAASAILSGPATNADATISAAATAAMGSTKLQAGAYQQGAQLLYKAVSQGTSANWSNKKQALADLALAQLIIGETEPGLDALHAVQAQFEQAGEHLLLIRSLENELRLLEHEHRNEEATAIKTRITELERTL